MISPLLICPIDGRELHLQNNMLQCSQNHSYDIAKQGYVNLLPVQQKRSKQPGDSKEMVKARYTFLQSNAYQAISDGLNALCLELLNQPHSCNQEVNRPSTILDAGCGDGYYMNRLDAAMNASDTLNNTKSQCIGLDISKFAIQAAAKTNKGIQWIVASNKAVPIADNSLDIIICAFGFPVFSQFRQKLKPNGKIILIESGEKHLIELRQILYPQLNPYQLNQHTEAQQCQLSWHSMSNLTTQITLDQNQIAHLLTMTPHIHRATKTNIDKLLTKKELLTTIDVNYRVLEQTTS